MTPIGYYKWYPRDFMSSKTVRRMSVTAKGVFRELLDLQWEDGSVPTDSDEARETIGATVEEWASFAKFFDVCFPNGVNQQLAEQREQSMSAIERQREAGRKGGNIAGKGRPKETEPKPEALPEQKPNENLTEPLAIVRGTPNPTTTTTTTNEQEFVSASARTFAEMGYDELSKIPAVASCTGLPVESRIARLEDAAKRNGFEIDESFVRWCGWITDKALGCAHFVNGSNHKTAAAMFDQYAADVRKEMARRAAQEPESAKIYTDPLECAVNQVFADFRAIGGQISKGTDVEAFARILKAERVTPDLLAKHARAALRNVRFMPPAFGLADLIRPYISESKELAVLDYDEKLAIERARFNDENYGEQKPTIVKRRMKWERNESDELEVAI